jgi:hypothetical protein
MSNSSPNSALPAPQVLTPVAQVASIQYPFLRREVQTADRAKTVWQMQRFSAHYEVTFSCRQLTIPQ